MSRSTRPQPRSRAALLLLSSAALIAATIIILGINSAGARRATTAAPTASHFVELPPTSAEPARRTLVVADRGEALPFMSGASDVLMASLESGKLPANPVRATVQSDANCQPDQDGVSHCLNQLDVGGSTIVVRHHHKMSEVPCLTPGEVVDVLSLKQYQG